MVCKWPPGQTLYMPALFPSSLAFEQENKDFTVPLFVMAVIAVVGRGLDCPRTPHSEECSLETSSGLLRPSEAAIKVLSRRSLLSLAAFTQSDGLRKLISKERKKELIPHICQNP